MDSLETCTNAMGGMMAALAKLPASENLVQAAYAVGKFEAKMEEMADNAHVCRLSALRYPWPPDKDCAGCRRVVSQYVKIFRLEVPYLLYGWDTITEEIERMFTMKEEQAAARREVGAGI